MVSIDNVYKTVLNILNKENRGYIVPEEFNTLATQAQNEIFEGYFSFRNYVVSNDSGLFRHKEKRRREDSFI